MMKLVMIAGVLLALLAVRSGAVERPSGAVGDGVADDTAALQRVIDERGELRLPRGKYRLTRPLLVDLDRVGFSSIVGDGGATLLMDGPGAAIVLQGTHTGSANPAAVQENVWDRQRMPLVDGIAIVGLHPESDGIRVDRTMAATLSRLSIRRVRHGIHIVNRNRNIIISECHVYHNRGAGIFLDQVNLHQINIANCHISYNAGGGVVVRGAEIRNLQIGTCDIEANVDPEGPPAANILFDVGRASITQGAIVGCTIQHSGNAPGSANIRFIGRPDQPPVAVGHFSIADNHLSDIGVNIHLRHARGVTITGNTVFGAREEALLVENSDHIVVANNIFDRHPGWDRPTRDGLVFRDSRNCTISASQVIGVEAKEGAIVIQRSRGFIISGCHVLDSAGPGIVLDEVEDSRISECVIRPRNDAPALQAKRGRRNHISNNSITGRVDVPSGSAVLLNNAVIAR